MAYLEKMQQLFSQSKFAELLEFCKTQLSLHPDDPDVLFFYAGALEAAEKHDAARNAFAKLFSITKDRLFLICESIPEFSGGKREEALASLNEALSGEEDCEKLFFIFRIAVRNGEGETASEALRKCFLSKPRETIEKLEAFFEAMGETDAERRMFFVSVLNLMKELEKRP